MYAKAKAGNEPETRGTGSYRRVSVYSSLRWLNTRPTVTAEGGGRLTNEEEQAGSASCCLPLHVDRRTTCGFDAEEAKMTQLDGVV